METKGRRASRAAGSTPAHGEPVDTVAIEAAASTLPEMVSELPKQAEIIAEATETMETALDVVTNAAASAAQPSIASPAAVTPAASSPDARGSSAALIQSPAALTRGLEAIGVEMAGMALSGIDSAAHTASDMLSVKTLSGAVALNGGLACASLDALIGGSLRLSELGVKLAGETAQAVLTQLGENWLVPRRIDA